MPEFYDLIEDMTVYEDDCIDYSSDSFTVEDEVDHQEESFMVEDDVTELIPGSDEQYVQYVEDEKQPEEVNWEKTKKPEHFMAYLGDKLQNIPRWSGRTVPGAERALAYIKNLDNEASHAMRRDYQGCIDEMELDGVRKDMRKMIDRLENHIERLQKNASVRVIEDGVCGICESSTPVWVDPKTEKSVCLSCEAEVSSPDDIKKEAGTPVLNVYVTPFERGIVSTLINSKVSAGRNIEDVYAKLKNKYNFNPREELAFTQLLADYGYPVIKDRGLIDEPSDPSSGDGIDFQTNYYG